MSGTNQQEQQNAVPQNPPPQNAPPQNPSPQANQPGPRPNPQRGSSNSEDEDYPTEKRMVAVGALGGVFAGAAVGVAVGLHQGKKAAAGAVTSDSVTSITTLSKEQLQMLQSVSSMNPIGTDWLLEQRIKVELVMKEMLETNSIEVLQKKNGKIQPFTFLAADVIFHDEVKTVMDKLTSKAVSAAATQKKELTDLVQALDTMRKEQKQE